MSNRNYEQLLIRLPIELKRAVYKRSITNMSSMNSEIVQALLRDPSFKNKEVSDDFE